MFTRNQLTSAALKVHQHVMPTPQYSWPLLCRRTGAEVWVKHENHGPIGAFKLRGGLVYMDELKRREPDCPGVIAATRGNHGQSIAFAARRLGMPAVLVIPHGNSREKNRAMQALGAELQVEGDDFQAALDHSRGLAEIRGLHAVPSFHEDLVCGVASYGLELFEALPDLDTVYVPLGLGSGICGVLAARDALGCTAEVVGVIAEGAPTYAKSLAAGHPVSHPVTTLIGDGVACRSPDPDALAIIRQKVTRLVTVSDDEMEAAMRIYYSDTHNVAEGAGAAPLAALLQEEAKQKGRKVAVVLSGGNVDTEVFRKVLSA